MVTIKRIIVLGSGRGSNFQALIDAERKNLFPGRIITFITDNPNAHAIERARKGEIPFFIIDFSLFHNKNQYEEKLLETMLSCAPDLIVLAGYMRIVGEKIVKQFKNHLINIHPALLPSFPGLNAQLQAIEYGVRITGCTIHFVTEEMDAGPIILQKEVYVDENENVESLAEKILAFEHKCLPYAVKLFCEDRLIINDRHVKILPRVS